MKKVITIALLLAFCLAMPALVSGCARHMGPYATSTAAPPVNPERPDALPPVVYQRTVKDR